MRGGYAAPAQLIRLPWRLIFVVLAIGIFGAMVL